MIEKLNSLETTPCREELNTHLNVKNGDTEVRVSVFDIVKKN